MMVNEIGVATEQLPDTIEDLSRFVLINEERVLAMKAQIRAIKKVSLAKEVYEQKLAEAQEIGQITVEAAQKMGELLLQIQKSSGGDRKTENFKIREGSNFEKSKSEITSEMGMTKDQVSQYQQMAQNPEAVQAAIQKAIEKGDVVSRSQVMKEIRAARDEARKEAEEQYKSRIAELESNKPHTDDLDKLIAEKQMQNAILTGKVKVIEKEVAPPDYEELKKRAIKAEREAAAWEQDYYKYQEKASKQLREAQDEISDLKAATKEGLDTENLSQNVFYFCTICNNFIGNVGGLVWLTDRIAEMPEKEQAVFLKAAYSFRDWALAFTQNLERSTAEYGAGNVTNNGLPSLVNKS